jgi:hypothetical protein
MPPFPWLAKLLDEMPVDIFFERHFGRDWLHLRPKDDSGLSELVTLHDLEMLMFDGERRDRLFHAVGGQGAPSNETDTPNHHCSADEAMDEWAEGKTLIFNGIDRQLPAIASLTRGLEGELKCRLWCNLYLTPANGHGFQTHYDSHDVFVLQLIGSKLWRIGASAADSPMPFQGHSDMPGMGAVSRELRLQPGEVLYLPRGILHDAVAEDDLSCHLTIGMHPKTFLDAILTAVTIAADRDPRFRRYMPMGTFSIGPEVIAESRQLMSSISDKDFADVGEAFCELLASQRRRSPEGLLSLKGKSGELTAEDWFRAKPHLMSSLFREDRQAVLHALGKAMTFPLSQADDVALCCSGKAFSLSDLKAQPSLAAAGAFVHRLLLDGVVDRLAPTDGRDAVPVDLIRQGEAG